MAISAKVTSTKEEIDLIRRAQSGDEAAFGGLYDKYRPKLYKYVFYKYVSSRRDRADAADDIVSITFIQAKEKLAQYDPAKGAFYPWLCWRAKLAWIELIIEPAKHEENLGGGGGGQGSNRDHDGEDHADISGDPFTEKMDLLEVRDALNPDWDGFERWDGIEEALDAAEHGEVPKDGLAKDISKLSSFQRDILRHLTDPDTSPRIREIEKKVAKSFLSDRMRNSLYRKLEIAIIGEERAAIKEEVENNLGAVCPITDSPAIQQKAKDGDPCAKAIMESAEPDYRGITATKKPKAKIRKQIDIAESMGVNKKRFDKAIYTIRKAIKNK
jgi:RNA polymerase sigma factor (sigma-70 family)